MSGVYISGMEMPTNCIKCSFEMYGYCLANKKKNVGEAVANFVKDENCPLIPVPENKRRIVYRGDVYNAIEAKRLKTFEHALNDPYISGMHNGFKQALFALATVDDVQTIIPADCTDKGER